jgi:hypothetical protein
MMDVTKIVVSHHRHADNFSDRELVFDGDGIRVVVMQWNDKGRKTLEVYVDGVKMGSTSNLLKSIGLGVMAKYGKGVYDESL